MKPKKAKRQRRDFDTIETRSIDDCRRMRDELAAILTQHRGRKVEGCDAVAYALRMAVDAAKKGEAK